MNIFVLAVCARFAALRHCNKHLPKMVLETTQMLYMALALRGDLKTNGGGTLKDYKLNKAHMRHPCTLWAAGSRDHFEWLLELGFALAKEHARRMKPKRPHACIEHLEHIRRCYNREVFPQKCTLQDWLEWTDLKTTDCVTTRSPPLGCEFGVTCMPSECRVDNDVVASYKAYYKFKKKNGMKMVWDRKDN